MPDLLITDAGLAAAIDADNSGLQLQLQTLVVADGRYTPMATQTAIQGSQLASVDFSAGRLSGSQLTLNALFVDGAWTAYEIGVFDSNGVLFAVASDGPTGTVLLIKVPNVNLMWQLTMLLARVPSGSVTVSPRVVITVESATTYQRGSVELATLAEVDTGRDTERAVTPKGVARRTPQANTLRLGLVELATVAEVQAGTDTERAVTPKGVARRTPQANTLRLGLVELATVAEVQAGRDDERAVTPEGVARRTPQANTLRLGLVELATVAEVQAGTDTERAVTPEGAAALVGTVAGVPVATIILHGGGTVPQGYLGCDGAAVSRTTYANLFAQIGTLHGAGDGAATFNLPDFRRRVPVGSGGTATAALNNVAGSTGGSETHTLAIGEMPSHSHAKGTLSTASAGSHSHAKGTLSTSSAGSHSHAKGTLSTSSAGSHTHSYSASNSSALSPQIASTNSNRALAPVAKTTGSAGSHSHTVSGSTASGGSHSHTVSGSTASGGSHSHTVSGSTGSVGGGNAFNLLQPSLVVSFLIKT